MASPTREATIQFLLVCLDNVQGKIDWEEVAVRTGQYKSGKFAYGPNINFVQQLTKISKQAYRRLLDKHFVESIENSRTQVVAPRTSDTSTKSKLQPKSKKHTASEDQEGKSEKKIKKARTVSEGQAVGVTDRLPVFGQENLMDQNAED